MFLYCAENEHYTNSDINLYYYNSSLNFYIALIMNILTIRI